MKNTQNTHWIRKLMKIRAGAADRPICAFAGWTICHAPSLARSQSIPTQTTFDVTAENAKDVLSKGADGILVILFHREAPAV